MCVFVAVLAQATQSPSSNGILNRGVGGRFASSSTRERSCTEYWHPWINFRIRSRRLIFAGISSVARGTSPNAQCQRYTRDRGSGKACRTGRLRKHQREAFETLARVRLFLEASVFSRVFRFSGPDFGWGLEPFLRSRDAAVREVQSCVCETFESTVTDPFL